MVAECAGVDGCVGQEGSLHSVTCSMCSFLQVAAFVAHQCSHPITSKTFSFPQLPYNIVACRGAQTTDCCVTTCVQVEQLLPKGVDSIPQLSVALVTISKALDSEMAAMPAHEVMGCCIGCEWVLHMAWEGATCGE